MSLEKINSLIQTKDISKIKEAISLASIFPTNIIEDYLYLFDWLFDVFHLDYYVLLPWVNKKEPEEKILAIVSINELFLGGSEDESSIDGSYSLLMPNKFHLFSNLQILKIATDNICFDDPVTFPNTLMEVEFYDYEGFLSGLYECTNIKRLVLSAFDVVILNQVFNTFSKLESLTFVGAKIKEIPISISNLKELSYLSVGNFGFDKKSKEYQVIPNFCTVILPTLTNLKELSIYHVDLSYCEFNFDNNKNLEVLELKGCNLKYITNSILNLKKLKELNLSYNYMIEIPEWLNELNSSIEITINMD